MLGKYEHMWAGHIEQMTIADYHNDVVDSDARDLHGHPYRAGPQSRNLEKPESNNTLKKTIVKTVAAELASPTVFGTKIEGKLRLWVDYRRLKNLPLDTAKLCQRWMNVSTHLETRESPAC